MISIPYSFFKKIYILFKKNTSEDNYKKIEDSKLFDRQFYLQTNPDVAQAEFDPLGHFIHSGALEGRSPSIHFDLPAYLEANPKARTSGLNPIIDWLEFGPKGERTAPKPLLSRDFPAYYETFGWLSENSNNLSSKPYVKFIISSNPATLASSEYIIHDSYILTTSAAEIQRDAILKAITSLSGPDSASFFVEISQKSGDEPTIGLVFINALIKEHDSSIFINAPEVRMYFINPLKIEFICTAGPILFSAFNSQHAASEWQRQLLP